MKKQRAEDTACIDGPVYQTKVYVKLQIANLSK